MKQWFEDKINKYQFRTIIIFISLFIIMIFIVHIYWSGWINEKHDSSEEIDIFLYLITGIFTGILAFIAYLQLPAIQKSTEGDFLLRIDIQWGNKEILKARKIIYKFRCEELEIFPSEFKGNQSILNSRIGEKIIKLSNNPARQDDFIYIINFLDFLETIGFLFAKKYVYIKDLNALCGKSLLYNYEIFKPYIEEHKKIPYESDYKNFEALCIQLMNEK